MNSEGTQKTPTRTAKTDTKKREDTNTQKQIKANFQRQAFGDQESKQIFNGEPLEAKHQSQFSAANL